MITLTFLVLFLSPLQNALVGLVDLSTKPNDAPVPAAAVLFAGGLVTAMFIQVTSAFVLTRIWLWNKR